jgi:hypothetical protein
MICCPYPSVFSGEPERFPSWIDAPVPPGSEKEAGDDSPKVLFIERMTQVAITRVQHTGSTWTADGSQT